MSDNLKQWAEKEKDAFGYSEEGLDDLWVNIDRELSKKDNRGKQIWMVAGRVAASVLLLALFTWLGLRTHHYQQFVNEGAALHAISSELAETEIFYASQVNEKLEIIKANNTDLHDEVSEAISDLDQEYQLLKQDLSDQADNEEVIAAMIDNYRLKLDLLERILSQIQSKEEIDAKAETNL